MDMEARSQIMQAQHNDRVKTVGRLLCSDHGARELLRWLVQQSGICQSSYVDNASLAAYREGKRAIGAEIMALAQEAGVIGSLLEKE